MATFYKSVRRLLSDQVIAVVDSQLAKLLGFGHVDFFFKYVLSLACENNCAPWW